MLATDTRLEELDSHHLLSHLFPLLRERTDFSPIIIDILEVIVTDLAKLQSEVQVLQNAGHAAADELAALSARVVSLQQAGADNITQEDIDALVESVSGVTNALSTATDSAATTSTPAGPGVTDPSTGGTTPAPEPTEQSRTVYTFDGDQSAVSANVWPSTGLETTDNPSKPVYFFVNDTKNPDGSWTVNGVGAGWTQYTGDTQPAGTESAETDTSATQVGSASVTGTAPAPGAETGTAAPGAPTPRSSEGADQETAPDPASGEEVENTASEPGQPPQAEESEGWDSEEEPDSGQVSPGG